LVESQDLDVTSSGQITKKSSITIHVSETTPKNISSSQSKSDIKSKNLSISVHDVAAMKSR
jgi:hypothetical protein